MPEERLDYRPHPRSKSLGALALHVAGIPSWTTNLLDEDSYDLAPDLARRQSVQPKDRAEVLAAFDANVAKAPCGSAPANYKVIGKAPTNAQCVSDADSYYYETLMGDEQGALCLDIDWVVGGCMELADDQPTHIEKYQIYQAQLGSLADGAWASWKELRRAAKRRLTL